LGHHLVISISRAAYASLWVIVGSNGRLVHLGNTAAGAADGHRHVMSKEWVDLYADKLWTSDSMIGLGFDVIDNRY